MNFNPREKSLLIFALHRLVDQAYSRAEACAQDHNNWYFNPGDEQKFIKDAKDAETLLERLYNE